MNQRAFVLPRRRRRPAIASPGFYREAGTRLGFYEPGDAPQIIDPVWNKVRSAAAIVCHEDIHQQLTVNTHHGVLTQLLSRMAETGQGREALDICVDVQWSTQETAATFAELMFVLQTHPEIFETEVAHLPTSPDPYRQLFDAANRLVPQQRVPTAKAIDRSDVIVAIAAASLQTGCLLKLAEVAVDDPQFAAYLEQEESPDDRFGRIARTLGAAGIDELLRTAASGRSGSGSPPDAGVQKLARLLETIARLAPTVAIEQAATLAPQTQRLLDLLFADATTGRASVGVRRDVPPPAIVDSPEKHRGLAEYLGPWVGDLVTWLPRCEAAGGSLHLIVGAPAPNECQLAAVCFRPPGSSLPLPDDLRGSMAPQAILEALEPYAGFPKVITFLSDAWIPWYGLLQSLPTQSWVHQRLLQAVRICSQRKLSIELVGRLLNFEAIADGARCFVFDLGGGLFVGCFDNPARPGTYAIQKIPSDAGLHLFHQALDMFGVERLEDPAAAVKDFELLRTIVARESRDPSGFGA